MIPFPIRDYVGREQSVAFLDAALKDEHGALIVVQGLGGIGKTSLVASYVTSRFPAGGIKWISVRDFLDPEAEMRESLSLLSNPTQRPSVVVIDGLDEARIALSPAVLEEVKARIPDTPIIITSRRSVMLQNASHLSLTGLSPEEAIEVLQLRSGKQIDRAIAEQLVLRVQNHPLALNLLGGLLRDRQPSELVTELDGSLFSLQEQSTLPESGIVEAIRPKIIEVSDILVEHLKRQPRDLHNLHPRKFEELIARLLADQGWEVTLTKQTRDGGRDIMAFMNTNLGRFLCLVEAKRYSPDRPVGVELVRGLYGVFCDHQANSALLVTTSRFTADAIEFQQRHNYQLSLRDYCDVVKWVNDYRGKK